MQKVYATEFYKNKRKQREIKKVGRSVARYPIKKPPEHSFQGFRILIYVTDYSAACFMESLTLPLSKPITLTFTSSPSLTTSVTFSTLLGASSEI